MLSSEDFRTRDIYLDYPFEDVKFRWDHRAHKVYRRSDGQPEEEIPYSSRLFKDATLSGTEITQEAYYQDP